MKTTTRLDSGKIKRRAKAGSITSLNHAGAAIRLAARRSIRSSPKPSPAGTPPHTRGRKRLKNAIKYAVEKTLSLVVIGPDVEVAGTSGKAHEFGGAYRREHYDRRPFMGPALEAVRDRLPALWAGSVQ